MDLVIESQIRDKTGCRTFLFGWKIAWRPQDWSPDEETCQQCSTVM